MTAAQKSGVRVLLVTPNLETNSTGRTYCLWLLAKHLGWTTRAVAVRGRKVWDPLAGTAFEHDCRFLSLLAPGELTSELEALVDWADVVIAVKPMPDSFGLAMPLAAAAARPLLLDIDDPDIEARTDWLSLSERLRGRIRHPLGYPRDYRQLLALKEAAQDYSVIVSNPTLQDIYGGALVPHVREEVPAPGYGDSTAPLVRFVGSAKTHKGVELLRRSVGRLSSQGYRLEITADPPADAAPWERWVGKTTFAAGQELVAGADIIALPSLPGSWSRAQLPVKLVDAMMLGRPTVASDVAPMRWALGGTGILFPPGDGDGLTAALRALSQPAERIRYGEATRERALAMFAVGAVAPTFDTAVREVLTKPGKSRVRNA